MQVLLSVFSVFTAHTVGFLCIGATGLQLVMLNLNVIGGMQGTVIVCLIILKSKTLKACLI